MWLNFVINFKRRKMKLLAKERNFISKEVENLMEQYHLKKLEILKQTKDYQVFDSERKSLYELDLKIKELEEKVFMPNISNFKINHHILLSLIILLLLIIIILIYIY